MTESGDSLIGWWQRTTGMTYTEDLRNYAMTDEIIKFAQDATPIESRKKHMLKINESFVGDVEESNRTYLDETTKNIEKATNFVQLKKVIVDENYLPDTTNNLFLTKEERKGEFTRKLTEARATREEFRREKFRETVGELTTEDIRRARFRAVGTFADYWKLSETEAREILTERGFRVDEETGRFG